MSTLKPTETVPELVAYICGVLVVGLTALAFKAWLLTVILGWFGVTVIGFWKAVAILIGIDLLFYSGSKK
jgi:hypothetical protein